MRSAQQWRQRTGRASSEKTPGAGLAAVAACPGSCRFRLRILPCIHMQLFVWRWLIVGTCWKTRLVGGGGSGLSRVMQFHTSHLSPVSQLRLSINLPCM